MSLGEPIRLAAGKALHGEPGEGAVRAYGGETQEKALNAATSVRNGRSHPVFGHALFAAPSAAQGSPVMTPPALEAMAHAVAQAEAQPAPGSKTEDASGEAPAGPYPSCGGELEEDAAFCGSCGARLAVEEGRKRPHRGDPLEDDAVFCVSCGQKLEA